MRQVIEKKPETLRPPVRFELRAKIVGAGFRSYSQFARQVGVDQAHISRILNGYLFPSPTLQRRLADELGLTLRELRTLL